MDPIPSPPRRNLILRILRSPDEPRLRAGWRLLLHTLIWILSSSILLLVFLLLQMQADFISAALELGSILIATWLARRFLDRRSFRSLGFKLTRRTWSDLAVGFTLPGLLMGLVFAVELLFGWTTFEGWAWQAAQPRQIVIDLLSGLLFFTLVGFSEEILSRGYHLQNLRDGLNLQWGLLLSSSVFAVLHALNPNSSWVSTLGILFAGYFLAYGWICTGQLWLSIGLHIGWNFFEGNVFGFPVSGMATFRLIDHRTIGPVWITGGAFGPEAGLIILPAMALGIYIMHVYSRDHLTDSPPQP
ncbi:MAG: CPBP family intramembrane metalloprotease [Anaerolineales bacterium]|nr:MAG: CPBP family intramembrane metalloprotease [Anaerolineales bacterium]